MFNHNSLFRYLSFVFYLVLTCDLAIINHRILFSLLRRTTLFFLVDTSYFINDSWFLVGHLFLLNGFLFFNFSFVNWFSSMGDSPYIAKYPVLLDYLVILIVVVFIINVLLMVYFAVISLLFFYDTCSILLKLFFGP